MDAAGVNRPLVKGAAFLGIFKYLKIRSHEGKALARVREALSPETARALDRKVFAIANYPYPVFIDFIRTIDRVLGRGDLAVCAELGAFAAHLDIESIYEIYKKRARPQDLSRDGTVIWKSYYSNAGNMKAESVLPERTVVRIYDFPAMDPAHCRLMAGWMNQALSESGARIVETLHETVCCSRGGAFHEFSCRWKPPDS
jgi:hypothetical protein